MFTGSEAVKFRLKNSYQLVDVLDQLGDRYGDQRQFIIEPSPRLKYIFTSVKMSGQTKHYGDGYYKLSVDYSINLSAFAWVIMILGILFCLIGLLVLLGPVLARSDVEKKIHQALQELE